MSAVMPIMLTNTRTNFMALAAMVASAKIPPTELRHYIDGLKMIEVGEDFYGEFAPAASIILAARIGELEPAYAELRAGWQKNLDALIESVEIAPEDRHPGNGQQMLAALMALRSSKEDGFKEEAFGDLTGEAERVRDEGIARFQDALSEIALMVIDPDSIEMDNKADPELLELALAHSKALPLEIGHFFGNAERLAEAKRRHPLWIKRQEELLAKRRAELESGLVAAVEDGIEARDEKKHRNRVNDAGLTPEQRGARQARMHEAAAPMYDLIRRITEIAHLNERDHTGVVDGDGLLEVAHRCEGMVARIEGRAN